MNQKLRFGGFSATLHFLDNLNEYLFLNMFFFSDILLLHVIVNTFLS